jgi:muramoyltetrapeptide carboxypeptidase
MLVNCGKDRKMKCPPFLKAGDKVALIATARKVSIAEMQPGIATLRSRGWQVQEGENLYAAHHQFAGDDRLRLHDLQRALDDPEIRAIFIARGGYGTMRLLDSLVPEGFMRNPKWVVGYSDVSALHAWVQGHGYASIHGTMPLNFGHSAAATDALLDVLSGKYPAMNSPAHALDIRGSAKGTLFGGNLSLIYAMQGSKEAQIPQDGILFIEDLDEYLYHIDRMMQSLRRSGMLGRIKGLITGGMSDMKDNAIPFGMSAEEIIYHTVKPYGIPVCFGFSAGHVKDNMPLILGAPVGLSVDEGGTCLQYLFQDGKS